MCLIAHGMILADNLHLPQYYLTYNAFVRHLRMIEEYFECKSAILANVGNEKYHITPSAHLQT